MSDPVFIALVAALTVAYAWLTWDNPGPRSREEHDARLDGAACGAVCGELSPERSCACHLPRGHVGAHEGRRGPYQLSSWASGLGGR